MKLKGCLTIAVSILVSIAPLATRAADLDYDDVHVQYTQYEYTSTDTVQSGFNYAFGFRYDMKEDLPGWAVQGDYSQGTINPRIPTYGNLGTEAYSLGILYHYTLNDHMDLVPRFDYNSDQIGYKTYASSDITQTGWSYGLGARGFIVSQVEYQAGAIHSQVGGSSNATYVGLLYDFSFGLGIGMDRQRTTANGISTNLWDILIRYNF